MNGRGQMSLLIENPSRGNLSRALKASFDFPAKVAGESLTEKPGNFVRLLLLDLLVIQSFEEDVQNQNVFSGGGHTGAQPAHP